MCTECRLARLEAEDACAFQYSSVCVQHVAHAGFAPALPTAGAALRLGRGGGGSVVAGVYLCATR